jgi:hypothetical protein
MGKFAALHVEKRVINEEPCRIIKGFENVIPTNELPDEYFRGYPRFYGYTKKHNKVDKVIVRTSDRDRVELSVGSVIPEREFQKVLATMKKAGQRLGKINVARKSNWSGFEKVEI